VLTNVGYLSPLRTIMIHKLLLLFLFYRIEDTESHIAIHASLTSIQTAGYASASRGGYLHSIIAQR